jgi:short-subunit dehydrogenase
MRKINKSKELSEIAEKENLPLNVLQLDVTDDISLQQTIQFIAEKDKRIDILINNAGYTQFGAVEDLSSEKVYEQFNTNVFSVFRTIKEVVPIMRKQLERGTIISIGSANSFFGIPCASAYVATKFALEDITQSLRFELDPFGIKVILIELDAIRTNIITNSMFLSKKLQDSNQQNNIFPFTEMTKSIMKKSKEVVANGVHPQVVANVILKSIKIEKPDWRYHVGDDAKKLFETRSRMNDNEFEMFLMKLFNLKVLVIN